MNKLNLAVTLLFVTLGSNPAAAATFTLLHSFDGGNDSGLPLGGVTLSGSTLFGTTVGEFAGANGDGTVFKLNTDGTGFQLLHTFAGGANDGDEPAANVTLGGATLYGTTDSGGFNNAGTVFKLNTDGAGFQLLRSFVGGANDGRRPFHDLTLSGQSLYGTTFRGGSNNAGTVFRLNTDGTGFQLLHSFAGNATSASSNPSDVMLSGAALYGTTYIGGASALGTVFKLNADGTGFQVLHSFAGGASDGTNPSGGVALSGDTLYGITQTGGASNRGTVFKMNTDGTGFQLLHSFAGGANDGSAPQAGLTLNGSTLYGTTYSGGSNNSGTVFKLNTGGAGFQLLHSFAGSAANTSSHPSHVTLSGATLYGTTYVGGPANVGTVFALTVPQPFAGTFFDEAPLGADSYAAAPDDEELGFATTQEPTGDANPLIGVAAIGANRVLTHRSVNATTIFDAVDLHDRTDVEVSVALQVSNATFNAGDFIHIYATNGSQNIDLFNQLGTATADELDTLAGDGFVTFSAALPAGWTTAQLVIESSSNSTTGAERYDFDNILFSGIAIPVPEPTSLMLALFGSAAAGIFFLRNSSFPWKTRLRG